MRRIGSNRVQPERQVCRDLFVTLPGRQKAQNVHFPGRQALNLVGRRCCLDRFRRFLLKEFDDFSRNLRGHRRAPALRVVEGRLQRLSVPASAVLAQGISATASIEPFACARHTCEPRTIHIPPALAGVGSIPSPPIASRRRNPFPSKTPHVALVTYQILPLASA